MKKGGLKVYKVSQVAEMMELSQKTIRRMIRGKRIPYHKIGGSVRISHDDIETVLQNTRIK